MDAILYYEGQSIGFTEGFDLAEIKARVDREYNKPVVAVDSAASPLEIEKARQQSISLSTAVKGGLKMAPPPAAPAASALIQEMSARITNLADRITNLAGVCRMVDRDIELVGEVSVQTIDAVRAAIAGSALIPYLSPAEIAAAAFGFGIVAEDDQLVAFAEWILKNNSCAGAA